MIPSKFSDLLDKFFLIRFDCNELFFELNKSIKNKEVLISRIFRKYDYRNIIGKRLMIQLEALIFNLIRELIC